MEFVEGKCCGDCAKCQLPQRPQTMSGMQACAVANILPMVFCTHDLIVEHNAVLAQLLKKKDAEIDELKQLVKDTLKACGKCHHDDSDDNQGENERSIEEQEQSPATAEEEPKRAKKLK